MEFDFLVLSGDSRPLLTFALKLLTVIIDGIKPMRLANYSHIPAAVQIVVDKIIISALLQGLFVSNALYPRHHSRY